MTRAETLRALADRVEKGETGPKIDGDILLALHPEYGEAPWRRGVPEDVSNTFWHDGSGAPKRTMTASAYSTSIDAQDTLGVQIIGLTIEGDGYGNPWYIAHALPLTWGLHGAITGRAPTEPAARLAAILRAMAAKEGCP